MAGKKPSALHRGTVPPPPAQRNASFPFFSAEEKTQRAETPPEAAVGSGRSKNPHPPSVSVSPGLSRSAEPCPGDATCGTQHRAQQGSGARMHWLPGELLGEPATHTPALPGAGPGLAADGLRQENCRVSPRLLPPRGPICDVTAMTSRHAGPGLCGIRALLSHVAPRATTAWLEAAHPVLVAVCLWQERFCQGSVWSFCLSGRALGRQNSWG